MKFKGLLLCPAIICMIVIFSIAPGFSATYYVKNGGNDKENGLSDANAWATIAKVNSFARYPGFASGDVISFKRGSIWRNDETLGWDGSYISWGTINGLTIQDYGTGPLPRFDGNTQQPVLISGDGISNLIIKNLDISGMDYIGAAYAADWSMRVSHVNNITIDNIYCDLHKGASIYRLHEGTIKVSGAEGNIEIKNSTLLNGIRDTFANSISSWGSKDYTAMMTWNAGGTAKTEGSIRIHDNTIKNYYADGIQVGGSYTPDGCYIYDNTISGFGEQGLDFKASAYVYIYDNDISHNNFGVSPGGGSHAGAGIITSSGGYGSIWDSSVWVNKNFNIYSNYIHDTQYRGISITSGNVNVYQNHFKDCGNAIFIYGLSNNIHDNIIDLKGVVNPAYATAYKSAIYAANISWLQNNNISNNTIYINNSSYYYGICWQGTSGQRGNMITKNIIETSFNSPSVIPLYFQDSDNSSTYPQLAYNDLYNATSSARAKVKNSIYTVSNLSEWKSAYDIGAIFSDPMFSDPQNGDFSLRSGSPCILTNMTLGVSDLTKISNPATNSTALSAPENLVIMK